MYNIKKAFELLGKRVDDRITGVKGVATSLSFDLYGCIQLWINQPVGKDGNIPTGYWFDLERIRVLDDTHVITPPDFLSEAAAAVSGPETKAPPRQ